MVKILFDFLDVLAPDSRAILESFIVKRFNAHCESHPECKDALALFSQQCWHPDMMSSSSSSAPVLSSPVLLSPAAVINDGVSASGSLSVSSDRFSLIRAFCSSGCTGTARRKPHSPSTHSAVAPTSAGDDGAGAGAGAGGAASSPCNTNNNDNDADDDVVRAKSSHVAAAATAARRAVYRLGDSGNADEEDDNNMHVLWESLTSDPPIVKCLLGLHELNDVSLWIYSPEDPHFISHVLKRLPVAPFFESVSKVWRVLDCMEKDGRTVAARSRVAKAIGTLVHETVVQISTSRREAEEAVGDGWQGIHLVHNMLNRAASIEKFSHHDVHPAATETYHHSQQHKQQPSFESSSPPPSDPSARTPPFGPTSPVVGTASFDADKSHSVSRGGGGGGGKRLVTAHGIQSLGRIVLHAIPELASSSVLGEGVSPMLFQSQMQPMSKKFCVCNCFWTGVGVGIGGTIAAAVTFAVVSVIAVTTIRSFGFKKRASS